MKFQKTLISTTIAIFATCSLGASPSKGYKPYQFEPEFKKLIEDKIPENLKQEYPDLVNFHSEKIVKKADNLELQIYNIREDDFELDLEKLLSRPYADQIKTILVNWRAKNRHLIDEFHKLYNTLPCVSIPIFENTIGGSFSGYAQMMNGQFLTMAYESSIQEKQMPQKLEQDWIKMSDFITKAINCNKSLIGNLIHNAHYGSLFNYLKSYDHLLSEDGLKTIVEHTKRVDNFVETRKQIIFQERYATYVGLNMMYKVFKDFLRSQDNAIKNRFGDQGLDRHLKMIKDEGLKREGLFDLEKNIRTLEEYFKLVTYINFETMEDFEALEDGNKKVQAFLERREIAPKFLKARSNRLKESLSFMSKFKRFIGLDDGNELKKELDNFLGKSALTYIISNPNAYHDLFNDHEKIIHGINLYRIKLFKRQHGRLPSKLETQGLLIPYSIKSVKPVIDYEKEEFIYKTYNNELDIVNKI